MKVIEDLVSDSAASIDEIGALFKEEKKNAQVCATKVPELLADVTRTVAQDPATNGVVLIRSGGGFGNEMNTVMKALLLGLTFNRTLCAHEMKSQTMKFISSPLTAAFDANRKPACDAMMKEEMYYTAVEVAPTDKYVALDAGGWSGKVDYGFKAFSNLALTYRNDFSEIISCLSNTFFRPNEEVRRFIAPYLRRIRDADISIGIHIRSGDFAMTRYQGYVGSRVLSLNRHRRGSISEAELSRKIMDNLPLQCSTIQAALIHTVVFVGSDRLTNTSVWQKLSPMVTVLKTPGHPVHTGRSAVAVSRREGALKAVADFFLLTEVEWFASNVNYMASVGNTYARNVHQRRAPSRERFERLGPNYDCSYYRNSPPKSAVDSCQTNEALVNANHTAFASLGYTSKIVPSCGLRNFPELTPGPKQGDDDKRLCRTYLDQARVGDVIVSIGSNNEFGFEEQMLQCAPLGIHIATFDCTVKEPTKKPRSLRVSFHPYCIGEKDFGQHRTWETISLIALETAARRSQQVRGRIVVLKMDVEGWEWVVLPQIIRAANHSVPRRLPRQIAVEVHLKTHLRYNVPGFSRHGKFASLPDAQEKLVSLRSYMEESGFFLINRHDNPFCAHCSELLFAMA